MPGVALETSIQDCLRRPSPGAAAWSLGAARMFVGGVLSLVSRSPRSFSLCQAVVSVLVRFVAETGCGLAGESYVCLVRFGVGVAFWSSLERSYRYLAKYLESPFW